MSLALAAHVSATETEDGGMVLLDGRSGRHWKLNPTGGAILRVLLGEPSQEAAIGVLLRAHPQSAERIPDDVVNLVRTLRDRQLVAS
ncbi:lasso peptide biosynthesis PqqD family chaperone [Embleya hyalina]|uniref:Coenzyme PQQ synthesis protein D n=1 Tax=Embleya hyalina TaxID=516124 RepID=A0A401Z647_9ACTN|nr:lasso peptide biosynthesis PqqD family chaperone [Embleya hyalina]GCE02317.1 hypothetical protein EHYA_10094 [Embleya hyalina]